LGNGFGLLKVYYFLQGFLAGFAYLFYRFEVFQQFFGGGFAYAFYQFQFGGQGALIAFFAVKGDAKRWASSRKLLNDL
jgi:hypothetical protein